MGALRKKHWEGESWSRRRVREERRERMEKRKRENPESERVVHQTRENREGKKKKGGGKIERETRRGGALEKKVKTQTRKALRIYKTNIHTQRTDKQNQRK